MFHPHIDSNFQLSPNLTLPSPQNHLFYFGRDFGKTLDIQPFHFKISSKNHLFSQFYAPKMPKHLDNTHFYRSHPHISHFHISHSPIFTSKSPTFHSTQPSIFSYSTWVSSILMQLKFIPHTTTSPKSFRNTNNFHPGFTSIYQHNFPHKGLFCNFDTENQFYIITLTTVA